MDKYLIKLNSLHDVGLLAMISEMQDVQMLVVDSRNAFNNDIRYINTKSILGLMTIDITKPLELRIYQCPTDSMASLKQSLDYFLECSPMLDIQQYRYGEDVFNQNKLVRLNKDDIIIQPEIITCLRHVNNSLLSLVKTKENLIEKLTAREFEELVCEILDKNGLTVKLTKQTCDGGKDIIVCENRLIGNFLTYVECKKYRKDRPVNVGIVRELYGTVMADNATAGLLVTTSYFSKDAVTFTEKIRNRMSLMDYKKLLNVISHTE